mgnify:CR=1 FL=1
MTITNKEIALIGLGYVGLPLAIEFGKKRSIIGFDINHTRINELKNGIDVTFETSNQELKDAIHLKYTTKIDDIKNCKIFIVTVPTPIDKDKKLITTIRKADLAKDAADARPEVFSPGNALDAKITDLDTKTRRIKLSVKAAQIDEEKSLIAKFGEGATKSGATLKGIFEKAIGKKGKKEKKE